MAPPWRKSAEYAHWRKETIKRDKVCAICGTDSSLQAHHINDGSHHPLQRFDLNNSTTLCSFCHTMFHCSYKNSFREKCTEKDWANFNELITKLKVIL